ncbi:hypothetical protein REMIM1_PC00001 (plasmid) [Rhizobium etli bv. mimosae str. Mim1]|nr:hypothetical protein REMIM1_PC00001 [Rhizobium etli bv. mimosae str. Mim1]
MWFDPLRRVGFPRSVLKLVAKPAAAFQVLVQSSAAGRMNASCSPNQEACDGKEDIKRGIAIMEKAIAVEGARHRIGFKPAVNPSLFAKWAVSAATLWVPVPLA